MKIAIKLFPKKKERYRLSNCIKEYKYPKLSKDSSFDKDKFNGFGITAKLDGFVKVKVFQKGKLPEVHITYDSSKEYWRLVEDYELKTSKSIIFIRSGFEFDLATIPRFVWPIIAPFELSIVAPLIHDFLYVCKGKVGNSIFTREQADRIFLTLMKMEGVSWWRRSIAFRAVRIFGRVYWKD